MTDGLPLLAIAGLLLIKEAGVPVPVPGDLVVIGAGVAAGRGDLDPVVTLVLIVAASIVGGIGQYGLLRSVARPAMLRLIGRFTGPEVVERQADRLRRGGARSVALARMTPGVRIVAIAASALARIPAVAFIVGLATGNGLFIAAHFGLGFALGEPILSLVGGALGPLAIAGLGLAVLGGIGWLVLARRRRSSEPEAALAWADACCPACLTLAVVESRG